MTEESFEQIRQRLRETYPALRDLSDDEILFGPEEVFRSAYERLTELGTVTLSGDTTSQFHSNPHFPNIATRLIHLIEMIEQRYELDMARAVLDSDDAWESLKALPAYPSYLQEVSMEYRGAELKGGDRVVFLGNGPLPITLILLYRQHGVEGIGIERNPYYAAMSQVIVNKLGLADRVKIIEGDHFSLPLREHYKLLLLAYRAEPKEEIFAHLARTFADGTKIAFRTVLEENSNGHQTPADILYFIQRNNYFKSQNLPTEFKEYRLIRPEPPVMNALLITVKESVKAATGEFVTAIGV